MSFKAINTQEEFDEAIKERLDRAVKKYDGYKSPEEVMQLENSYKEKLDGFKGFIAPDEFNKTKTELEKQVASLTAENGTLKTNALKESIAEKAGLPRGFASRLTGATEADLTKDAESLAGMFKSAHVLPMAGQDTQTGKGDAKRSALAKLVKKMDE